MPSDSIVFVDTNILLYAASGRPDDAKKSARARQLLIDELVCISFQVLQEFYANAISPRKLGMSRVEALKWCAAWINYPITPLGVETFVRSLELVTKFQISNWDAAIIAAAEQFSCETIYSEDFNHGQLYDNVRVVNPFLIS